MKPRFLKIFGKKDSKDRQAWGVMVDGGEELKGGDTVEVTKKGGETVQVEIKELISRFYSLEEKEEESDDDAPF